MGDSVRVVAVVGRNPAPLVQLLWGLVQRGERVVEVRCVVLDERAERHLEEEVLAPGAALGQLRGAVGSWVPERVVCERGEGEACWRAVKALTASAEPVRLAAFPGRHARAALTLATCFNFLGRKRDEVLEVSLGARGAEGVKGFYFPGQSQPRVTFPDGTVREAREVEVQLEPVVLPRLRRLLPDLVNAAWNDVAALGQRGLEGFGVPDLVVDLEEGRAWLGHVELELAPLPLAWLAALARARVSGQEEGWLYSDSTAALAEVLQPFKHLPWVAQCKTKLLRKLVRRPPGSVGDAASMAYLGRVRYLVKQKLERAAKRHFPLHVAALVPEVGQVHSNGGPDHRQRLVLSPECIHVRGM